MLKATTTRFGLLPRSAAVFLGMLLLLVVTSPFVQALPHGDFVDAIMFTLVLCAAVQAVGAGRRAMIAAIVIAVPTVALRWFALARPGSQFAWLSTVGFLIFVAFIVALHTRYILGARRVDSEVICVAISTYVLLGLFWGGAYMLVGRTSPGSFSGVTPGRPLLGFDAVYFSIMTLTTVGYGDITPVSATARMLAMTEAITGTMYVAVIVARLVSLYTVEASRASDRGERS